MMNEVGHIATIATTFLLQCEVQNEAEIKTLKRKNKTQCCCYRIYWKNFYCFFQMNALYDLLNSVLIVYICMVDKCCVKKKKHIKKTKEMCFENYKNVLLIVFYKIDGIIERKKKKIKNHF